MNPHFGDVERVEIAGHRVTTLGDAFAGCFGGTFGGTFGGDLVADFSADSSGN
jgi:hypothetical protein